MLKQQFFVTHAKFNHFSEKICHTDGLVNNKRTLDIVTCSNLNVGPSQLFTKIPGIAAKVDDSALQKQRSWDSGLEDIKS